MSETKKHPLLRIFDSLRAYLKTSKALRLLICVALTAVMLFIFVIAIIPARYDLHIGQVPNVTIAATKDVVDEITTEQRRAEAAAQVTPTYKYQEGVTDSVLNTFEQIYAQLRAVRQYGETLPGRMPNRIYSRDELDYAGSMLTQLSLRDYQLTTLLNTSPEALDELHDNLYVAVKNTLSGNVTQGQESEAIQNISMIVGFKTDTDLLQNVVIPLLKQCIQPNMVIDQEATDAARQEAQKKVEPVVYKQGQNIVVRGEGRVTMNQLKMLDTLGLLRTAAFDVVIYAGAAILVILVMLAMLLTLRLIDPATMDNTSSLLLLSIVMVLTLAICICARLVNPYVMPIILCAMLLSPMLSLKSSICCNIAITILVSSIAAGVSEAFTVQMVNVIMTGCVSGTIAAIMMNKTASRVRALLTGGVAAAINFVVMLALGMMTASTLNGIVIDALWSAGGGLAAGLFSIAFQPLFEMIFNLPTPMRLLELSNPNSPLLRRLMLEAPGTYHHSILVANLAEASAEAVDANPLLARVGAYYHDIGKLKRPSYFKENQVGDDNAHDHTDPQVSAAILTAHTRDGVALARAYHLPAAIQQIIAEHHGNTPVMYFYHKALQMSDGKQVDIDSFRYDGNRPASKESAIIMLCDTIEAAVRSQKKNATPEELEDYIVKLVRGKLSDGQLNNAPLTLKDLDAICVACATVLRGVYHERIEYPNMQMDKRKPTKRLRKVEKKNIPVMAPHPVSDKSELKQPEQVNGNDMLVTPPIAPPPVSIDDLFTMQPPTKMDENEPDIENPPPFNVPEDEPGAEIQESADQEHMVDEEGSDEE